MAGISGILGGMADNVQYAAVLALLGLGIPDEEAARVLLGLWRRMPEMSDAALEMCVRTWKEARKSGIVLFTMEMDTPEKRGDTTGLYL
jgi:hypothetical protein